MTQESDKVKSMIAETLVSLRDSFAKAEFNFGNSFATKYIFHSCDRAGEEPERRLKPLKQK